MPPDSPACLDPRPREFEEGKEKGDASKGKESSLRAASQPYQAEMQNVRSHSTTVRENLGVVGKGSVV